MIDLNYAVYYNGKSSLDAGLRVEHRPVVPSSELVVTEFDIPDRDGVLHRTEGSVQDVEIPVEFAFVVDDEDLWLPKFREVTEWLYGTSDRRLIFSEEPDWFYQVFKVTITDTPERVCWLGGRFTATFTIRGYAYSVPGAEAQTSLFNKYDTSHPIYKLSGEANTVLTVNGNTMTVNVGQAVTIDTDLMLTYRSADGVMQNTSVTGNYDDLWLKPGANTVSATNGVTVSVIPRWRKRL